MMLIYIGILLIFTSISTNNAEIQNPMENDDLFEGDIVGIDPNDDDRNAVVNEAELWPAAVVHYEIDWRFRDISSFIYKAFEEYQNKTCVRFIKKTAATRDYIFIRNGYGCYSSVGRQGGEQEISLAEGCHDKVSALHELGHALGLWHEHSRSDRDEYLEIIWENIKKGHEHNFKKLKPWENNLLNEKFDYKSIMLYGEYAFAKDRKSMTMKPREPGAVIGLINDKPGLSDSDVRRINRLYECFGETRPERPEVPDFTCDFETDFCGMENQNINTNWTKTEGTLGGRTSNYLMVDAKDASFRRVRLVTPLFDSYGRKKGCFSFDTYFNGDGALHLVVMGHDTVSSSTLLKHVEKKDEWQPITLQVNLKGYARMSIDAHTRKTAGEGIVAVDNFRFRWHPCGE